MSIFFYRWKAFALFCFVSSAFSSIGRQYCPVTLRDEPKLHKSPCNCGEGNTLKVTVDSSQTLI